MKRMENEYAIDGDLIYVTIRQMNGRIHTVCLDLSDEWVIKRWRLGILLRKSDGRIVARVLHCKETSLLSRLLLRPDAGLCVDHINSDTLDNRRCNLRILTVAQNNQNLTGIRKNNKSGIQGVYWSFQHKKWRAAVRINGKAKHVGLFNDLDDAAVAVKRFRHKHVPFSKDANMEVL